MLARKPSVFAFLLALAAGCQGSLAMIAPRRPDGTPIFGGRGTRPQTTSAVSGDAQQYLNRLDAYLRSQGYGPAGAAIRNNAMPPTNIVAYAIDAQMGSCYATIGLGDSGTDLNMVVLDPYGRTEAHNVAQDTTPWVAFCPRQQGRYIVRLQMSRGTGGYYYLAYAGPNGRDPQLAAFFGTSGGGNVATNASSTPAPRTAQIDSATQGRYQAVDTSLQRESFTRASDPIGLVLDQRQERLFPLNLTSGACYAFASFGGPGTSDTDVFVVDGSGGELASDVRADRDAIVRFCPPSDGTYQLRTRLYTGSGPVFVAGWMQPRSVASNGGGGTTTTPVSSTTPVMTSQSTAASGIGEAYALVDTDMQARGYAIQGEPQDGTLDTGASRDFAITVERDKCYAIVTLGDSGVRNVDLTLLDGSGRVLDHETEVSGRAIVRTCASEAGARTVRLQMAAGSGAFKFALYQFTRGTHGPFGLAGLTWVRLSEVTSLLDTENYSPSIDFSIETGRLASGRTASAALNLAANKCYAVVVVGGDGISSVGISLDRGGSPVAENRTGSSFPDVRICTQQAGRYDLRINAMTGAGNYAYEVFERATR